MQLLNKYVLIQTDKAQDKIGSIYIPKIAQKKLTSGTILGFSDKLKGKLQVNSKVWFNEYPEVPNQKSRVIWLDENTVLTPYDSLNCVQGLYPYMDLKASGTKILVVIDKEAQKKNHFIGSLNLFKPEWNTQYGFNSQYGKILSVGEETTDMKVGDTAIFNQFIESLDYTLIKVLENGDEIRVVECGTSFNYENYGFVHDGEFISSENYVFVNETENKTLWQVGRNRAGLYVKDEMQWKSDFRFFTVSHSNNTYKKGEVLLARGQSASVDNLNIKYIHSELIEMKM